MMQVLSLGAGVQSTAMALMAAHGVIKPMPQCAIFADTGSEPAAVYDHLRWLMSGNVLPFPVHTVGKPVALGESLLSGDNSTGQRFSSIPAFLDTGEPGGGIGRRQCTKEYKIEPLLKKQRELLGYAPRKRIPPSSMSVWIGISTDEVVRVRPSRHAWLVNRHPLIEQRLSRGDCVEWLKRNGYSEPPKSACTFCPYRTNEQWRALRDGDPAGWAEALKIDAALRAQTGGFSARMRHKPFLHRSMKPLAEADISSAEERGQINMFNNECEGMCGV